MLYMYTFIFMLALYHIRSFFFISIYIYSRLFPIAYCVLPSAHCLLAIAYCLLPPAGCLLPTQYGAVRYSMYRAHRSYSMYRMYYMHSIYCTVCTVRTIKFLLWGCCAHKPGSAQQTTKHYQ